MAYKDPNKDVEKRKEEIIKELNSNKALWEAYGEYKEKDIHSLIDSYALSKARLEIQGNYTHFHHEYVLNEWDRRAWFALAEIQHKKLLDLQCRWRAKEIELEGFQTSFEFEHLPVPILDLDIIPDITEEDIETYRNFLKTPNGTVWFYYSLSDHQDHQSVKSSHEDGGSFFSNYYEYHYTVKGNTGLLLLPDLIGQEERRLINITMDHFRNQNRETPKKSPDKKGLEHYKDDEQIKLAHFLGEKNVAGFIKDCSRWIKVKPQMEVDWAMKYLSFCYPEPVPMLAAPTWQDAIEQTVLRHITEKLHERLPTIYEEYLLKKSISTSLGYIKGEDSRKESKKPPLMVWMEMGQLLEKGIAIDSKDFFQERDWD